MDYQHRLFVVAALYAGKPEGVAIETTLGRARVLARKLAFDWVGREYVVYIWRNGEDWRNHSTVFAYRAYCERSDLPIGAAVGGLIDSNDDCLRG